MFVSSHINIIQNLTKRRIYLKTITNSSLKDIIQIIMGAWCVKKIFFYINNSVLFFSWNQLFVYIWQESQTTTTFSKSYQPEPKFLKHNNDLLVKYFVCIYFIVKSTVCLHFGRSWNFQILNLVKVFKLGLGHPHPQGPWKVRLLKIDLTSVSLLLYWNYLGGSILIVQK